jgi:hypothetical protein
MKIQSLPSLLLVTLLLLAGCGTPPAPTATPTVPPPVTLTPPTGPVYVSGCTTADLETWTEATYFLLRDFVGLMTEAEAQSPTEVRAILPRMAQLRDAVLAIPAPEACATEAHTLLTGMLEAVLQILQRYANGETIDLAAEMAPINTVLGDVQNLQAALEEQLNAQRN